MRAFIDAEVSKEELLETLAWHRVEGWIVQGWYYWQGGRGCAVGCTLHEYAPGEEESHALYEDLFGIPWSLAYLEDAIFEGLDVGSARAWPERFVGAIPEGADLAGMADRLALWILGGEDGPMARWCDREYLQPTLDLYRQLLAGVPPRVGRWREAARFARNAATSAASSLDRAAACAVAYGHRERDYGKLAMAAARIAGRLAEQSRPAGASLASARPAVERARTEAWRRIADKLVEVLEGAEAASAGGE